LMLSENSFKNYAPFPDNAPEFTWLGGNGVEYGTEQQLGMVWVVDDNPEAQYPVTDDVTQQERINRRADGVLDDDIPYRPDLPRFARPGSAHSGGVIVVFCDGHTEFLREDIDYVTYQRLLTSNGRKCVDPRDHTDNLDTGEPINVFRTAPPLSESDYR
jgi:prepilin-type processing-associated H-X9-DG protein